MRRSAERQGNKGSLIWLFEVRNELVVSPLRVRRRICATPAGLGIVVHRGSCLPGAMLQKGCEFGICQSWICCGSNFGTSGVKMLELQIVLLGLVTFLYGFELLSLVTFSYGHELLGLTISMVCSLRGSDLSCSSGCQG